MQTTISLSTRSRPAMWSGRILGAIVVVALLIDAGTCLFAPQLLAKSMEETGFAMRLLPVIGSILAASTVLYAIPRTSVLGAILVTGFLGGAICTHLRMGDIGSPPQIVSALLGVAAWASLYLRLGAVRSLLPLTSAKALGSTPMANALGSPAFSAAQDRQHQAR